MHQNSDAQHEAVVNALYEASAEPASWPDALSRLVRWTGADAVMLVVSDGDRRQVSMQHGHDTDCLAQYTRDWLEEDPRLVPSTGVDAQRRAQHLAALKTWQSKHGYTASFADRVCEDDASCSWLLVSSRDADNQGRVAIRYGRVRRHFERALRLGRREAELARRSDALNQIVDDLPLGVLLLEADGRVHHANASAWRMLLREDALQLRDGRLHALREGDDKRLQALMHDVDPHHTSMSTRWLALPRRSGDTPYTLAVHAGARASGESFGNSTHGHCTSVFIGDAAHMPVIGAEALRALFDLTAREAQVCVLLLRGLCVEEAARDLGISPRTARVYLQQVYGKVGVHRQADLVRLLMCCPTAATAPTASSEEAPYVTAPRRCTTPPPLLGATPRHACSPGAA